MKGCCLDCNRQPLSNALAAPVSELAACSRLPAPGWARPGQMAGCRAQGRVSPNRLTPEPAQDSSDPVLRVNALPDARGPRSWA